MTDPYVGRLAFFRVYSGTVEAGKTVLNSTKGQRERLGRILQMHANHREDIPAVYSGDIAAAVGLKNKMAAAMPPAVAVMPPVKAPNSPCSLTAFFAPWERA